MNPSQPPGDAVTKLAQVPLLEGLDRALLSDLTTEMTWRDVARRETVILKGSTGDHLLFLLVGRLQVVDVTEGGREIGLNILNPGDHFGELSIIDGLPRSASVVALDPSTVALLPKPTAWRLFHQHPLVAQRMLTGLALRLRNATTYQTILSLPNANQRIYAVLNRLITHDNTGLTIINVLPKQQELAIMANTSRESVSRALKVLLVNQVLKKSRRRLIVLKPSLLKNLATNDGEQSRRALLAQA